MSGTGYGGAGMITRLWHGWTTPANAEGYERLLQEEIFIGIRDRNIAGFRGIELFRRPAGELVEFVTVMRFDDFAAVRAFAGTDYEAAVVPEAGRRLLHHFDQRSAHYEVVSPLP